MLELNHLYNYEKDDSIVGVFFSTETTAEAHKMLRGFKIYKSRNTNKTILKILFDANFGTSVDQNTSEKILRSQVDGLLVLKDRIGEWVRKNGQKNFSEKVIY